MAVPILGYWDVRGLTTPIRLILEYAGVKYEEKLYKCGPPPTFDRGQWLTDKVSLGLDFPNLPYFIDGDLKISQSEVIMRYLARKHGLDAKTEHDRIRVELLTAVIRDYHMDYAKTVYNPSFNELKEDFIKGLPDKFKALSKFLGQNKYVAGDYLTYVDFILFEHLEFISYLVKDILKDYPVLEQFHKRISTLEAVDNYFKSPKAIKFPFNGAPAYFGGQYSEQLQQSLKN